MDYNRACRILNLGLKHTEKMLRKAYHIAALKNHPDKNPNKENANILFQEISEAYDFLLNRHDERYRYVNHNISYSELLKTIISEFDIDGTFKSNVFIETTLKGIINKASLKIFEKLDKEKSQKLFDFIFQYNSIFNYDKDMLKKIQTILRYKMKDDNVIILNPNIDDLLEGNIFKLDIFEKEFYIPLWHHELYYQVEKNDLIIKIEPELDITDTKIKSLHLDNNNNIFIYLNYSIAKILEENELTFSLGENKFTIEGAEINIIKKQTKVLYNKGIFKMNDKNIFEPKGKTNIYVEIELY
uniref:J domain-containing protein n=1 Tax=viral metagenome TaxID=1070528 RepID=A0A6C0CPB0_9ZZZZ